MNQMHSLLKRQLKKFFNSTYAVPQEWEPFINAINNAYREFDEDRALLERALELSSQELIEANSEMRAIFEALPDLLFRFDHDGRVIDYKAGRVNDLYFYPEKLIGKRIQDVPPAHVGSKFLECIRKVQDTKAIQSFEYSLPMQDRECFYEARLLPLIEDQIIAIVRNITTRKKAELALRQSEEEYRTLVENINAGIYRSSPDVYGHFIQVNNAMVKIFGAASAEDLIGCCVLDFYRDKEARDAFLQEIDQKGFVKDKELYLRKQDGTPIIVSCTAAIQYDAFGSKRWIDGVMEDITEHKKIEEEIAKTSKLESLGILAGGIAHDFNNILTAILGNISLARMKTEQGGVVFSCLDNAEKASIRAQTLTQQLLTFSKGGAPVKKASSINDLLRDSANFVVTGSNIRCDFHIPDDLPTVEIDEGQISRVIHNLVINAQQSMPQGGVIHIQAERIAITSTSDEPPGLPLQDGNYVKISIQDQGIGIPEEYLGKIFDPYFTTKEKGSGLGLTTSYSIMKRHGGHITLQSTVGTGTTFFLYLPALHEGAAAKKKEQRSQIKGHGKILLMDDEEIIRDVGGGMLQYLGYEVTVAKNGAEAIFLATDAMKRGESYDAIIMDLTIPGGMGGKEAASRLQALDCSSKMIASSGYSNDPVLSEYKKYGFCAIAPKPYGIEELRNILHQVITKN